MAKHRVANEEVAAFFDEKLSRLTGRTFHLSMLGFQLSSSSNVFPVKTGQGLELKLP